MSDSRNIKEYQYKSAIAKPIYDFVAQKRGSGYLYNSEAKKLHHFDRFIMESKQDVCTITKQLFEAYTEKTPNDSERNHRARYFLIRQFAEFMTIQGFKSYVPQNIRLKKSKRQFIPYIFTEEELSKLFKAADAYKLPIRANNNSKLELIIPIIFKMLYGGGFRISELTHLKVSDVDLENGIVKVVHSKFGNARLVPLNDSLIKELEIYSKKVHCKACDDAMFFPKSNGELYLESTFYEHFRKLLWKAGISHGGRGKGPRLHDVRHTFAVHCLKNWVKQDCDVIALLPYLSAYMGHANLNATQDYLRLTADAFPDLVKMLESTYGYIIPRIGGVSYDL